MSPRPERIQKHCLYFAPDEKVSGKEQRGQGIAAIIFSFIKAGAYCSISRPSFLIQLSWCYKKRFTSLHLFRSTDGALTLWNNASFFFLCRSACCICVSPALVTLISFRGSCLCLSRDPVSSAHLPGLSMTQAKAHFVPQSHLAIFCAQPSLRPRCNPRWKGGTKTYVLKGVQSH